ncbi:class I SAM-dependent methyltransferase [Speluncibacter jeojiensis]|uniref:Class I SAM-dependent methyltransferase n=1 Tax=Speluncibacter jeojiensis TaxID=2710754 RepID=A0A9X4M2R5_9ACTN|nr:class I SAM-dependent methyltransferase [Corynebacteriales bacterium D3-21]
MAQNDPLPLGAVQQTLYFPLAARARETGRRRAILRDPKAVEILDALNVPARRYSRWPATAIMVLRTAILDRWVREFLAEHPCGTVVEIGTGLNTRFERTDNGSVRWFDLDLPDTMALRRRYFDDTDRRRTVAASVLDEDWMDRLETSPPPWLFVAEGVLVYLPEDRVRRTLSVLSRRFPGAVLAADLYTRDEVRRQHRRAARNNLEVPWSWACDDPAELRESGWCPLESTTIARPPREVRARLSPAYRTLLPLFDPMLRRSFTLNRFAAAPN